MSTLLCLAFYGILLAMATPGCSLNAAPQASRPRPDCEQVVSAGCEPLENPICLGATLPYQYTSLVLADDVSSQSDVATRLRLWSGLSAVPRCWDVVQPYLCAVYLPRCQNQTLDSGATSINVSVVQLPAKELCDATSSACRIVAAYGGWPYYLSCENSQFVQGCIVSNVL